MNRHLPQTAGQRIDAFLLKAARWLSTIFRPEFFPLLGFVCLFLFTYLNLLPWAFKGAILSLVLL